MKLAFPPFVDTRSAAYFIDEQQEFRNYNLYIFKHSEKYMLNILTVPTYNNMQFIFKSILQKMANFLHTFDRKTR